MKPRERFRQTILFGNPDKIPLQPGYPRESTLKKWHQQGLPADVNWQHYLFAQLGIDYKFPDYDRNLGVSFKMIPTFEEKVLEHKNGHYIVQDWMGAITEISDEYDYTYIREAKDFVTRKWHKFPVENRDDWEKMKWRYNSDQEERFPSDFTQQAEILNKGDYPVSFKFNGPFWQLREWLGFENLCLKLIEEPDLIEDMIDFWTDFVSNIIGKILAIIDIDSVMIGEDMAYKAHSMISPQMVNRFLRPTYEQWVTQIKKAGCPIVDMDSDGFVGELIPIWIDVGINCCDPIEVAAGNDIVEYREKFGAKMAYRMGIDKRKLAKGGQTMQEEVLRVVPPLLKTGGFIPGCDHGVPPDISWPDFIAYTRLLAELTGWL